MERELYLVNGMRAPTMLDRTQRCWKSVVVLIAISGCTEPMQAEPGELDTNGSGGAAAAGTAGTGGTVAAGGIGGWATSPPSCRVVEFAVPTADCNPHAITRGPDGNVWFTEWAGNKVGRITPAGTITEFHIPFQSGAEDITAGPDGNVWFSEWGYGLNSDNNVGRVTPTGVITEFPVGGGAQTWPFGITTGPDGNLWFTEFTAKRIGRMNRSGGELTEFPFPEPGSLAEPYDIVAGPDGNLWYTDFGNDTISRITPTGMITQFSAAGRAPGGITVGPDGNLWFTESESDSNGNGIQGIGRISMDGTITDFSLPEPNSAPFDIVAGPDGNLWFTDSTRNEIGRISPDGIVARCPVPAADSMPERIALGADGQLWFTEWSGNKIGRMEP